MDEVDVLKLVATVRQHAFNLHNYLRWGHLERVYENGLAHRLSKSGLQVERQRPLPVFDQDGTLLGDYVADMIVEDVLLLELKACSGLAPEHLAQVLGYLRAANFRHGMLINFGSHKIEIKKLVL